MSSKVSFLLWSAVRSSASSLPSESLEFVASSQLLHPFLPSPSLPSPTHRSCLLGPGPITAHVDFMSLFPQPSYL